MVSGVPGAGAYEIQRAATARASFRKVAVVNGTEWMDKAAVGKTYWYRVRALGGESGSDSAPGNVVTLSGACAKHSVTASNDAATGRNVLNWDKVAGAASYEILRAEGNGHLFHLKPKVS